MQVEFPEELRDEEQLDLEQSTSNRRRRLGLIAIVVVIALIASAVSFAVGRLSTIGGNANPTTTSAEAGFSRDMIVHHDQGVEMSLIIRDLTTDDDVRLLAYDIITTQGTQSGMMSGWLQVWRLPAYSADPAMTWMTRPGLEGTGHDHTGQAEAAHVAGEPMPGLATDEQLDELRGLTGVEAEITFMTLMIAHHSGAIEMAEAVLDRSTNPLVVQFAEGIVESQQAEIDLMNNMIGDRS